MSDYLETDWFGLTATRTRQTSDSIEIGYESYRHGMTEMKILLTKAILLIPISIFLVSCTKENKLDFFDFLKKNENSINEIAKNKISNQMKIERNKRSRINPNFPLPDDILNASGKELLEKVNTSKHIRNPFQKNLSDNVTLHFIGLGEIAMGCESFGVIIEDIKRSYIIDLFAFTPLFINPNPDWTMWELDEENEVIKFSGNYGIKEVFVDLKNQKVAVFTVKSGTNKNDKVIIGTNKTHFHFNKNHYYLEAPWLEYQYVISFIDEFLKIRYEQQKKLEEIELEF